jgi:hypothetical protein
MTNAILMEVDVVSPAGEAGVLRFCDRAIRPFPPSDADRPNAAFDDRLKTPPALRRALFDDLASLSPGLGFGAAVLANADKGLEPWKAHAWGEVRVWLWTVGEPFGSAIPLGRGPCTPPDFDRRGSRPGEVRLGFYDYRAEVEGALQQALFAGDNGVAGELYEGTADDLKDRHKPMGWGRLDDAHIPAPMVNAGVLAHLLNEGPISAPVQVFDRGDDAGFADQGALVGPAFDAFAPSPASRCQDLTRGLVKINGDPVGRLTFGFRAGPAAGYVETTGPVLARMLAKAGVPPERISASVEALPDTGVVGAWFDDATSARDALGWVARSAMAVLAPDRDGVWTAELLAPPAAVADHEIAPDELVDYSNDATAPEPAGEVKVGWGRVWTTFRGADLAPALRGTAAETRLAEDYRWTVDPDATVKARYPRTWRTLEFTTALRLEADAVALAARLKAMFGLRPDGQPRRVWRVVIELTAATQAVALGKTIGLPGTDLEGLFLLIGSEPMRPRRDLVTWTLWG